MRILTDSGKHVLATLVFTWMIVLMVSAILNAMASEEPHQKEVVKTE